jgi:hypothetical protein
MSTNSDEHRLGRVAFGRRENRMTYHLVSADRFSVGVPSRKEVTMTKTGQTIYKCNESRGADRENALGCCMHPMIVKLNNKHREQISTMIKL